MKKTVVMALVGTLALSLAACGNTSESDNDNTSEDAVELEDEFEIEIKDEDEIEDGFKDETEDEPEDTASYEYNVELYSGDIDITLDTIQPDNIYFKITNNLDDVIEVDLDHFLLDGVEYTYEDTNYSTPSITLASGETRSYEFCDWNCGNEINFQISNPDCTTFSGVFEYWYESDGIVMFANISTTDVGENGAEIKDESENESKEDSEDTLFYEYNVKLYSGDIDITLTTIQPDNIYFSITNNLDDVIEVDLDHFLLDGIEYTYEDTNYSTMSIMLASGETRSYKFCDWDCGNEIDFEISNPDCSTFSGVFEYWYESDGIVMFANISTTDLE